MPPTSRIRVRIEIMVRFRVAEVRAQDRKLNLATGDSIPVAFVCVNKCGPKVYEPNHRSHQTGYTVMVADQFVLARYGHHSVPAAFPFLSDSHVLWEVALVSLH